MPTFLIVATEYTVNVIVKGVPLLQYRLVQLIQSSGSLLLLFESSGSTFASLLPRLQSPWLFIVGL